MGHKRFLFILIMIIINVMTVMNVVLAILFSSHCERWFQNNFYSRFPIGVIDQLLHRGIFSSHSTLSRETPSQESVPSWQQTFCCQTCCRRCIHKFPWDSPQICTYPPWIRVCQAVVS